MAASDPVEAVFPFPLELLVLPFPPAPLSLTLALSLSLALALPPLFFAFALAAATAAADFLELGRGARPERRGLETASSSLSPSLLLSPSLSLSSSAFPLPPAEAAAAEARFVREVPRGGRLAFAAPAAGAFDLPDLVLPALVTLLALALPLEPVFQMTSRHGRIERERAEAVNLHWLEIGLRESYHYTFNGREGIR